MEIAPGGNLFCLICCLIIVGIFMGLRGTYSLGEDFKDKDFGGASYKEMGLFFVGGVTPQDTMQIF